MPDFVNKVSQSPGPYPFIYILPAGCLHATVTACMTPKPKVFIVGLFTEKYADPSLKA